MTPNEYSDSEFIKLREKAHDLEVKVARLEEQEKAGDRALAIASRALEHSQTVSNEWRKENIDQRALFPTTAKVDGQFQTEAAERRAVESRVYVLEKASNADQGKHSANILWLGLAITIVNILIGVVFHVWK